MSESCLVPFSPVAGNVSLLYARLCSLTNPTEPLDFRPKAEEVFYVGDLGQPEDSCDDHRLDSYVV